MLDVNKEGKSSLAVQFARGGYHTESGRNPHVPNPEMSMAFNTNMSAFRNTPEIMKRIRESVTTATANAPLSPQDFEVRVERELIEYTRRRVAADLDEVARIAGAAVYLSKE